MGTQWMDRLLCCPSPPMLSPQQWGVAGHPPSTLAIVVADPALLDAPVVPIPLAFPPSQESPGLLLRDPGRPPPALLFGCQTGVGRTNLAMAMGTLVLHHHRGATQKPE